MNESSQGKSATWDILGFGAVAVDDMVYLDAFPEPDSKARVRARERHGGGLCATALVAAARLGARCAYAGVLGNDELSRFSLDELRREGIDVSQVLVDENARPHHSTILVEAQRQTRTILSFDDGVTSFPSVKITPQVLEGARVAFLDHTTQGAAIVKAAREAGVPTVADIERAVGGLEEWIGGISHLIVGEKFAREWTKQGDVEAAVRELGAQRSVAVVTLGERGCIASGRALKMQVLRVPAYEVDTVDTTGCGDAFHGAYAAELARGSDIITRLRVASAVAAIKAQHRGGRGGLPDREAARAFVREHN